MNDPTFVCKDCGVNVYDALGEVRERCLMCQWIEDIEPPDREELIEWLKSTQGRSEPSGA